MQGRQIYLLCICGSLSRMDAKALPRMRKGNSYPYTLYRGKYQLLTADGSSFTFTRNASDPDSYFAPDGKTTNGYNQVHGIPLFDILYKRYTDCVVQPIRKKNEFLALCTLVDRHNPPPASVPLFIADRGFHALNVFAHVIERHGFFLIRATDVKMQRLVGKDLPSDEFPMEEIKNLYHLLASEQ